MVERADDRLDCGDGGDAGLRHAFGDRCHRRGAAKDHRGLVVGLRREAAHEVLGDETS
jgi:hypothetical protein